MDKKTKDFVLAVITLAFGLWMTIQGLGIVRTAAQKPFNVEKVTLSPGFLPTVLGLMLIFFSLCLLFFSLRGSEKGVGKLLGEHISSFITSVKTGVLDKNMHRMAIGMAIMFVFTFILVGFRVGNFFLPFWISGAIFTFILMTYLGAVKWWQAAIITVVTMAIIVVLFVNGFHAILP